MCPSVGASMKKFDFCLAADTPMLGPKLARAAHIWVYVLLFVAFCANSSRKSQAKVQGNNFWRIRHIFFLGGVMIGENH